MATNKSERSQREQFIEAARGLGVDEDEARFKAKLRRIARADVPPEQRKKPKRTEEIN